MKKIVLYIVFMITALMMSCEEKYDMYSEPDNRLNIISDTLINYTFTIKPASVMLDTVWVRVQTMGLLSDQDRVVKFEQVEADSLNAEPGVHYVAFDDSSLAELYRMPGDSSVTEVPVVVLRDPSLKESDVTLKITFGDNGWF